MVVKRRLYTCMNNKELLQLLNITLSNGEIDNDILIEKVETNNFNKIITLKRKSTKQYCPLCNSVMYSKGFYKRKIKHPILQDGYNLILIVKQRKYRCTNYECNHYLNEEFGFLEKYKQTSLITPYLILNSLKDTTNTCASIARQYHVSDTYVHSIMMRYVDFKKLPLNKVISIDEVFLDIEYDKRYCVIIRDFINDEIIDILPNRYENTLRSFILSYSKEERSKVEYLISDMYKPYIQLKKYFPNAKNIIDSYHVINFINTRIRQYLNIVKRKYIKLNNYEKDDINYRTNRNHKTHKDSKELYLLKHHDWVLFSKLENEPYISGQRFNRSLNMFVNNRQIKEMFYELDDNFKVFKELKELYLNFNSECINNKNKARSELIKIIKIYKESNHSIFNEFAILLNNHFDMIIESFTLIQKENKDGEIYYQRLSNGPIEAFNRHPKDLKRAARGFTNFDFIRNRILWSYRKNPSVLLIPKTYNEIHKIGKKRKEYKKK